VFLGQTKNTEKHFYNLGVGLSITAVDTNVVQYDVWVYATRAFRQSADSSGISS